MQEELKLRCDYYSKDLHKCYKTFNGECDGDNCEVYRLLEEVDYEKGCRNLLGAKVHELQQALKKIKQHRIAEINDVHEEENDAILNIINETEEIK